MRLPASKALIAAALLFSLALQAPAETAYSLDQAAAPVKHGSKSAKTKARGRGSKSRKGAWKRRGQQQIQSERATAIQEALIRERYLTGSPNGQWDTRTQAAMARYQTDNGWQSKVTPDSRALIKLGLGPDYSEKNMMLFVPKPTSDSVAASAPAGVATSKQQQR